MENILILIILAVIIGAAAFYIFKAKKGGNKCIGCPHGSSCKAKGCCPGNKNN